jgi:Ni/Co efflux regulator RcnB
MNRKIIISTVMAMSLTAGSAAFAQDHDRQDDHRDDRHSDRYDKHAHNEERGAGPNHDFRKGGRLSGEYRNRQYVVSDWRGHHLHAPPRGYHWVQTGPDYVLAAVATGVIAQIVLGN